MDRKRWKTVLAALMLIVPAGALAEQDVAAHPQPLSLLEDENPVYASNKRLVFDMWRSIVNAGQVELADEMLTQGYIQHSPVLPTGREAFKGVFSVVPRSAVPDLVSPPLVALLAEGDKVVMVLQEKLTEPQGSGTYTSAHFNLFRIEDGRLAEHWHSVQQAPGPRVLPPEQGGPQRVTGLTGKAQLALIASQNRALACNKRLVFDMWRQVVDAGREDLAGLYFSKDYVEHDPNFGSGLDGLRAQFGGKSGTRIPASIQAPLVAMVAQGDLVAVVTGREHPHPIRVGDTYTTTWFDMYRIENGRIAEHWNGAMKPGTPVMQFGN